MTATIPKKRQYTAREAAAIIGRSPSTVRRMVAQPRNEYLQEQFERRERIREFHDDQGHSWAQTAAHFGIHVDTAKRLSYRARKERAAEREAELRGPSLFDVQAETA